MKDEQRNLKKSINKAMKTPLKPTKESIRNTDIPREQYGEPVIDTNGSEKGIMEKAGEDLEQKSRSKRLDKPLKIFGSICIMAAIVAFIFTGTSSVDTSESARNALKNKTSTAISAGTILLSKDENVGSMDYTINHKSEVKDTKIWVWDYAAEDGDYVQVLVNGTPVADAFMIRHKPREISVPAAGLVQIKGIRDGGGGITYAVRYEINGTSYFNGAPEGQFNTYTLIKE